MLEGADIPSGMCVCHHCDNPGCVRPDHLYIGTQLENMRDVKRRGRGSDMRGQNHPRTKLTEEDVVWIRQLGATQKQIAKCFGISQQCVSSIKTKTNWNYPE